MTTEELKAAIKELSVSERREIGKYILELEREHLQTELPEDLKKLSSVVQKEAEKVKQRAMDEIERLKKRKGS
jgi:hypothetical protein